MERYELLNKMLMPADKLLDFNLMMLKKFKLYDPMRFALVKNLKKVLLWNFKVQNKLEVLGVENLPKEGGYILAANHQSWSDAQVLSVGLPVKAQFIAKSMLFEFPFLRQIMAMNDAFMIKRGGDAEGLEHVTEALKSGKIVGIFPEGTIPGEEDIPRSAVERDTGLLRGRTGAVRMALRAKVPIVPVGISGTGQSFPPECYPRLEKMPLPKPVPITVKIGAPITFDSDYETVSKEDLQDMTKKVMLAISKLVDFKRSFVPYEVPVKNAPWDPEQPLRFLPPGEHDLGVLVLHGFTSSIKTVDGIAPYLERNKLPYIMPILRGHGSKPEDMAGVTHRDWYADAEAALKELRQSVKRVVVIGLSMGGLVALELAKHHPEDIAEVITIAAALKFKNPLVHVTSAISKLVPYWPSPNSFNDKELKKNCRNYTKFPTSAFTSLLEYSNLVEKDLPAIKTPLLILASKKDQIVCPRAAMIIEEKAGSAEKKLVWFEKSGHEMLQDLEAGSVFEMVEQEILKRRAAK